MPEKDEHSKTPVQIDVGHLRTKNEEKQEIDEVKTITLMDSLNLSIKTIKNILIFLLVISITFSLLTCFYFFESILISLKNFPSLSYTFGYTLIFISILGFLSYFSFKKWFNLGKKKFNNPLFLSGLFFYFISISKFFELIINIYNKGLIIEEHIALFLMKTKFVFINFGIIIIFLIIFNNIILNKMEIYKNRVSDNNIIRVRNYFLILYWITSVTFLSLIPEMVLFELVEFILKNVILILIIYLFFNFNKNYKNIGVNNRILMQGFVLNYLIYLIKMFYNFLQIDYIEGQFIQIIIEIVEIFSYFIIFFGLINDTYYKEKKYYFPNN